MNPLAIAAAVQVGSGLLGNAMSQGDRNASMRQYQEMLRAYKNLKAPDIKQQELNLFLQQYLGDYNPEELQQQQLATDYYNNVQVDPRLRQTRMDQLNLLESMAKTGMTEAEQAQANKMLRQQAAEQQSKVADIERQAAQSGMASSGASLLAKLQATQSARNQASGDKDALLAQMLNRKLQASESAGGLAGTLENTDYNRGMEKADKRLDIDRFNVQNANQARQMNWAERNRAGLRNLDTKQGLEGSNVGLRNQEQIHNKGLLQQQFQNELARLSGMSGASSNVANQYANRADATAGMWTGIGQGVAQGIGAYNQGQIADRDFALKARKAGYDPSSF